MERLIMDVTQQHRSRVQIRVCGLQRSGNHAIISWIMAQHKAGPCVFLNNVRHGDSDPYQSCRELRCSGLTEQTDVERLRSAKKRLLVFSYEDDESYMTCRHDFLGSAFCPEFECRREEYLGTSEHRLNIIIVRDSFNFFASRLSKRHSGVLSGISEVELIAHHWKAMARAALEIESKPESETFVANYNRWFADQEYRKRLSRKVFGTYSDESMSTVATFGGGSSFDGDRYSRAPVIEYLARWKRLLDPRVYLRFKYHLRRLTAPGADRMKVLERWKEMADDNDYRSVFADPEILELSEQLFGEIPGTREFVAEIAAH